MANIIKEKRHFYKRYPFGALIIILIIFSPVIIGFVGSWINEIITGVSCHEGNCGWMAFNWLSLITFPFGSIFLIIYLIVGLDEFFKLIRTK
jgi:hypothetical protein